MKIIILTFIAIVASVTAKKYPIKCSMNRGRSFSDNAWIHLNYTGNYIYFEEQLNEKSYVELRYHVFENDNQLFEHWAMFCNKDSDVDGADVVDIVWKVLSIREDSCPINEQYNNLTNPVDGTLDLEEWQTPESNQIAILAQIDIGITPNVDMTLECTLDK